MIEFVLDCSVAISWCLVDEDNDYANAVLDLMPNAEAFVREIWPLEMAIAAVYSSFRLVRYTVEGRTLQLIKRILAYILTKPPLLKSIPNDRAAILFPHNV